MSMLQNSLGINKIYILCILLKLILFSFHTQHNFIPYFQRHNGYSSQRGGPVPASGCSVRIHIIFNCLSIGHLFIHHMFEKVQTQLVREKLAGNGT